ETMKTITISQADIEKRVSRLANLQPLPLADSLDMPQEAKDIIYSRTILSVIGLEADAETPVSKGAPIKGAGGLVMAYAVCPPGNGPSLHSHQVTYETFTVMKGRFEITWNDNGENRVELDPLDTISVPPGVCRAFRNISDEEGILQVLISGGVHDMGDIDLPESIADRLETFGDGVLQQFEDRGFTFTAGKDTNA
ncbi:MAG: cupin domain-containing protein, partial [Alphaproteobacteria bacterium]|nr:cupin domain-containing protein [Alphaproteobacteria bacterium]